MYVFILQRASLSFKESGHTDHQIRASLNAFFCVMAEKIYFDSFMLKWLFAIS